MLVRRRRWARPRLPSRVRWSTRCPATRGVRREPWLSVRARRGPRLQVHRRRRPRRAIGRPRKERWRRGLGGDTRRACRCGRGPRCRRRRGGHPCWERGARPPISRHTAQTVRYPADHGAERVDLCAPAGRRQQREAQQQVVQVRVLNGEHAVPVIRRRRAGARYSLQEGQARGRAAPADACHATGGMRRGRGGRAKLSGCSGAHRSRTTSYALSIDSKFTLSSSGAPARATQLDTATRGADASAKAYISSSMPTSAASASAPRSRLGAAPPPFGGRMGRRPPAERRARERLARPPSSPARVSWGRYKHKSQI